MAEANSSANTRAVQVRAPPSLTSCVDIVDRATAPYHNERPTRGAIITLDFKYPSNIFFVENEPIPKFDLNFMIQIEEEYRVPIGIQDVAVNHFNLDNNIAELLNNSKRFPKFEDVSFKEGTIRAQMRSPSDYCDWGENNVRFVVLSNIYPSNINISVSLSTMNGTHQLRRAFTGASRPYMASSPNEEKLRELLCWTAGLGYDKLFKAYLDQLPVGLEMEDAFGMTPFSWAAQNGCAPVVRLALQQAGSICARRRTARGPAPLEAAARSKNETIFMSFLKWLKYLEDPIASDTTPEADEIPDRVSDLVDEDIEREIHSAARSEQTVTIQKLIRMLCKKQGGENEQKDWLANKMVEAAKDGDLYLVQVLRSCGAQVNCMDDTNSTPLAGAIKKGQTKVAEYLILQGAKDDNNFALRKAVENSHHSTVRALLKVKALGEGGIKTDLLRIATGNKDSTTLMLLKLEKGTEKLATPDDLDSSVDKLFEATVVDFSEDRSPEFHELTVDELMNKEETFFNIADGSTFKWFHLPANNMKWAEALIDRISHRNPSLAHKVLEQKRWIKRQHEGVEGSSHARFMMPACHDFQEAFRNKKKFAFEKEDRHVVLFMPYLHWDEEKALKKRSDIIATYHQKASPSEASSTLSAHTSKDAQQVPAKTSDEKITSDERNKRDQKLLESYLLSDESHPDKDSHHLLHIRRTLDQSLYHNLKDTKSRDADQTVRRYQKMLYQKMSYTEKQLNEAPFAVIMVDQLWLWILLGPSGQAQTVVTCFPSRDWFDVDKGPSPEGLDPRRTTDVLQTTKSYIQQRPEAVKTPYDLAGVIVSRCSRALLDHSTDMLDFTEAYENSISYIVRSDYSPFYIVYVSNSLRTSTDPMRINLEQMNEEVLLFNTFNHLMQTRTKTMQGLQSQKARRPTDEDDPREADSCLANDIVEEIKNLNPDPESMGNSGKTGEHKRIQESKQAEELRKSKMFKESKERLQEYRDYTMDTEIPDEKDIDGKKKAQRKGQTKKSETEDQRLTKLFEKFGRFFVLDITREISLLRQIKDIQDELEMMEKVFTGQKEVVEALDRIIRSMIRSNDPHNDIETEELSAESNLRRRHSYPISAGDGSESTHGLLKRSNTVESDITDDPGSAVGDEHLFAYEQHGYLDKETQKRKDFLNQAQSIIWQFRHQKQNLPIRTVNRFAEQIKKMNERARNTNQALNTLVDLKQKQNNMIDTRTARLQAEQSHTMAMEAERQGRTLMVFTIVTIIFLPLSFIAAFFAIPVNEFKDITLDYVSMITFPVSAATSLLIIVVGFAASEWEWITEIVGPRLPKWLSKYWKRNDDPNQIESSTQQSEGTPRRIVTMMRNVNYSPV